MSDFITDFLKGQSDCSKGVPHKAGNSEAYDRGYATEHDAEQARTWRTEQQGKRMGIGR